MTRTFSLYAAERRLRATGRALVEPPATRAAEALAGLAIHRGPFVLTVAKCVAELIRARLRRTR
jgi:hypothetical protein